MGGMLNNREIATIIWIILFFLFALLKEKLRSSFCQFVRITFSRFILGLIASMLVYVFLMVLTFQKIGFWDTSALKDTVAWTFGVAFVMLFNVNKAGEEEHYFQRIFSDNIKLAVILEFITNMYAFSLALELIMVPVATILIMMKMVAGLKPEHKQVDSSVGYILGIIGTVLIVATLRGIIVDFRSFASLRTLRDFLLPPVFTIALLPYIYVLALFIKYDSIFKRINYTNDDSDLALYAKRKVLRTFHINLTKLSKWSKEAGILRFSDRNEVLTRLEKPMID